MEKVAMNSTIDTELKRKELVSSIASLGPVVIAFSGGVDSSVVAAAASAAPNVICIAVTAVSPSLASWQAELATRIAGEIGIEHHFVSTDEGGREGYRRNAGDRCFYCKQTLYEFLRPIAEARGARILSGTNADDLGDHRPGIQAGQQASVVTPLADLGIGKALVRMLAESFGLSNAELPASPCLASRIEYHVEVTPNRLAMIDAAESWLRRHGLLESRVRLHAGEMARIEVRTQQLTRIIELEQDEQLSKAFLGFGFKNVTLDLQGFRSGNMNEPLFNLSVVTSSNVAASTTSTSGD